MAARKKTTKKKSRGGSGGKEYPPDVLGSLARSLAAGPAPAGVLVRGDEPYFRFQAVELLRAAARERGAEVSTHDAGDSEFNSAALLDDLAAAPLFAVERCVVLRNAGKLLAGKVRAGLADSVGRALIAFLARKAGGTDGAGGGGLVLDAETLRKDSKVAKALAGAGGTVVECRRLWDSPPPWSPNADPRSTELVRWILDRAREKEVTLNRDQAAFVAAATGNRLAALDDQLERLRRGGERELAEVVGWDASASPFDVAESIVLGDLPRALAGLESLFTSGFEEKGGGRKRDAGASVQLLLAALNGKVRESRTGAAALAQGLDEGEAASRAGVPTWPQARAAFATRTGQRDAHEWESMLRDLGALERCTRRSGTVDAGDFSAFALRWRRRRSATRR
jgi:DNA polymerase III delta subunit